jgi:predicted ribosome quality control (RQC) complex YloA/Tae2 family protein
MYFDTLTVTAIADELRADLLGGRVQHVVLPDDLSVALEIYRQGQRRYLLASADAQYARVHLVAEKPRRGVEAESPLLLMLRKYVRGGHLINIIQPPWERVLHFQFEHPEGNTTLVVETMGRHSNIMLLDADKTVLEAVKRVTPDMSRVRPIRPQLSYALPPPQDKTPPDQLTAEGLSRSIEDASPGDQLWRTLLRQVLGLSPLSAREVVYRVTGQARAVVSAGLAPARLVEAIRELTQPVETGAWQPSSVVQGGLIRAYAPYPLTQYDDYILLDSMNAAVHTYYAQEIGRDAYAEARRSAREPIDAARERLERRLRSLERSRVDADEVARLRQSGELILGYQWQIEPGQEVLEMAYEIDGEPLRIELDPGLSAVENAQAYFEQYGKAKRAAQQVPRRMAQAKLQLEYLDQLETDLALAETRPDIDAVYQALVESGFARQPTQHKPSGRSEPIRAEAGDFTIWIGRNARQNEIVTFQKAAKDDLWLHARGVPGAHVVIKRAGQDIPAEVVQRAAQWAAHQSAARGNAHVDVDVTRVRSVRRIKGGAPGQVVYTDETTLNVEPRAPT